MDLNALFDFAFLGAMRVPDVTYPKRRAKQPVHRLQRKTTGDAVLQAGHVHVYEPKSTQLPSMDPCLPVVSTPHSSS